MKKQISSTIKAHLIRGVVYLLLLPAVFVIPLVLGQRGATNSAIDAAKKPSAVGVSSTSEAVETQGSISPPPEFTPIALWDQYNSAEFPMAGVWNQYDNPATEPPIGIGSQQFEPALNTLDDQVADDFVLTAPPPPMYLYITGVRVMGEYSTGGGPASSFNVYLYANGAGNLPGTLIVSFLNRPYTGTPPDFMINLGNPFTLPSGTYWVSVQARQDFNTNGQWFWHNRTVQRNAGAAWQNPGDGYGTGCITWNRKNACMPDQIWPDQVFQILGFAEGPPPTPTTTPEPRVTPTPRPRPSPAPRP